MQLECYLWHLQKSWSVTSSKEFFTTLNITLKVHWLYHRYGVGRQELNLPMFIEMGDKMADNLGHFLTSSIA
jgi:hypothetical protein